MEPRKRDVVYGWWGRGVVTDVAIGQGVFRVKANSGATAWVLNELITKNEGGQARDRRGKMKRLGLTLANYGG